MLHKILVIDDEAEVRQAINLQLSSGGYTVIEAENGEEGIAKINDEDNPIAVDAIICDIRMPKVNGIDAIKYFRQEYPSTPVIVLTGYPNVDLAVEVMKEGVVDYLVKPIEKEKLLAAVKKAASQHHIFEHSGAEI